MSEATDNRLSERVQVMARALREPRVGLLQKLADAVGMEEMERLFARTLEIEAEGGMLTSDGKRRRTPGGVFFQLTKEIVPPNERRKLFRVRRPKSPTAGIQQPTKKPKPSPSAPAAPTLEQAISYLRAATKVPAEQKESATVKATIIGRPLQIKQMETFSVVVMALKAAPPLPKGLPPFPDTASGSIVVFIAQKQWVKAQAALDADPEDELIVEGFPTGEPKRAIFGFWAQSCTTKAIQRDLREQKTKRA